MKSSICEGIDEQLQQERDLIQNTIDRLKEKKKRHERIVFGITETIKDLQKDKEQI